MNKHQIKVLADIGIVSGQLSAASMILPFIIPGLDQTKIPVIILGLLFTIVSWIFSVLIVRRIKK